MMPRRILISLCLLLGALPCMAAGTWRDKATIITHPGQIELINLGVVEQNPPVVKIKVADKYFWVFNEVVVPSVHSVQLLAFVKVNEGEDVLEIGSGSGVQSVFAADKARSVVATDINPAAVKNTQYNVDRHGVDHVVTTRQGDLFGPIKAGETFDVILFNVQYPYDAQTMHFWTLHERFFKEVGRFLRANGRIYYQSGYIYNLPRIEKMVKSNGLRIMRMEMDNVVEYGKEPIVFMIQHEPKKP